MAKPPINPDDILLGGAVGSNELSQLQTEYWRMQLSRAREEEAEREEAKRVALAARKQGAEAMNNARRQELEKQRACPHMKPNFQTAITGQRDHQHHSIYTCVYCAAMFDNQTLPGHLYPSAEKIGGPNQ